MKRLQALIARTEREVKGCVALCPELDIAGQGNTVEESRSNPAEASEPFIETADASEVRRRLQSTVLISNLDVAVE